mgnify:CR=1 FL=1|jgi:hypothetical protein
MKHQDEETGCQTVYRRDWILLILLSFRRPIRLSISTEDAVSARWWLYVASFILGITLVIFGLSQANEALTFVGVIIGAVLFVTRKYIQ